uniref:40S ribosomal protein S8 n=1 Tax=Populus trichocarpa TaxID=3694 RepID=A0A2K1YHI2_POPTR
MGISRDSLHKRRATGGKKKAWRKKRKQPANTKLSSNKTVRRIRVRGGNMKWRALRLDTGNYFWGSEAMTRKTKILDAVYNASNNELVRSQTLVKWYLQHYGVEIDRKKKTIATAKKEGEVELGRLMASISSRPGQCGRANGYILEGRELSFI